MRLNRLPRDALDNVLSHLRMSDILALARTSHSMSTALAPFLHDAHVRLDPQCKRHLLHPHSHVAPLITSLSIHNPLSVHELRLLGNACSNLSVISFHNIAKGIQSTHLHTLFQAIGPTVQVFSAQFCAALTGPVLLPPLAMHCSNLTDIHLRFAPRVYAEHLDQLLERVGHQLQTLELDTCVGVDDAVVSIIAERCPVLTHLCVGSAEDVGDDGVLALAEAPCAKTLRHLDIRGCMHVTDVGVFAIATCCAALLHLNVWRVCVTSYAIRAIAEGLGEKLETLIMGDCIGIDDTALFSIADNCDALCNLEMVGLKRVSDAGILSLFDAKKGGRARLETLTIDGCKSISNIGILAAVGLWDGRWTRTVVDSETASSHNCSESQSVVSESEEEQQALRKEGEYCNCDESDQCGPSNCLYGNLEDGAEDDIVHLQDGEEGTEVYVDSYEEDVDDGETSEASGSIRTDLSSETSEDGWTDLENLEGFEPATNVSYLRKLCATGMTELGPALFRHIREARPYLELRVDVVTENSIRECVNGESSREVSPSDCIPWTGYPCREYFKDGGWLEVRQRRTKDSRGEVSVSGTMTATGIDTRAESYAKYRDATVLEQVGLS